MVKCMKTRGLSCSFPFSGFFSASGSGKLTKSTKWNRHKQWTKTARFLVTPTAWLFHLILRWRHNEHDGVLNHQRLDCLLNCFSGRRSKETSKLRVTGLCEGNLPVTGEFPAQRSSNAENVSIWWRHHDITVSFCLSMKQSWHLSRINSLVPGDAFICNTISDNGLLSVRRQAITWINDGLLIVNWATHFNWICIKILHFSVNVVCKRSDILWILWTADMRLILSHDTKLSIKFDTSSYHSACFILTRKQNQGQFQGVRFNAVRHSSSGELRGATTLSCLNTGAPESSQDWPRNWFRPVMGHRDLARTGQFRSVGFPGANRDPNSRNDKANWST